MAALCSAITEARASASAALAQGTPQGDSAITIDSNIAQKGRAQAKARRVNLMRYRPFAERAPEANSQRAFCERRCIILAPCVSSASTFRVGVRPIGAPVADMAETPLNQDVGHYIPRMEYDVLSRFELMRREMCAFFWLR